MGIRGGNVIPMPARKAYSILSWIGSLILTTVLFFGVLPALQGSPFFSMGLDVPDSFDPTHDGTFSPVNLAPQNLAKPGNIPVTIPVTEPKKKQEKKHPEIDLSGIRTTGSSRHDDPRRIEEKQEESVSTEPPSQDVIDAIVDRVLPPDDEVKKKNETAGNQSVTNTTANETITDSTSPQVNQTEQTNSTEAPAGNQTQQNQTTTAQPPANQTNSTEPANQSSQSHPETNQTAFSPSSANETTTEPPPEGEAPQNNTAAA